MRLKKEIGLAEILLNVRLMILSKGAFNLIIHTRITCRKLMQFNM